MPTQPPIDGLPLWAQILISVMVGIATLAVAFSGYFKRDKPVVQAAEPQSAAVLAATIADMGAVRHLADVCIRLSGCVDQLTKAVDEQTHHARNNIEIEREVCARLRELRESSERLAAIMERHLK